MSRRISEIFSRSLYTWKIIEHSHSNYHLAPLPTLKQTFKRTIPFRQKCLYAHGLSTCSIYGHNCGSRCSKGDGQFKKTRKSQRRLLSLSSSLSQENDFLVLKDTEKPTDVSSDTQEMEAEMAEILSQFRDLLEGGAKETVSTETIERVWTFYKIFLSKKKSTILMLTEQDTENLLVILEADDREGDVKWNRIIELLNNLRKYGRQLPLNIYSKILRAYGKLGLWKKAETIFRRLEMGELTVVEDNVSIETFRTLIDAYLICGRPDLAIDFAFSKKNFSLIQPNQEKRTAHGEESDALAIWAQIMKACAQLGDVEGAWKIFNLLWEDGREAVQPHIFNYLLKAYWSHIKIMGFKTDDSSISRWWEVAVNKPPPTEFWVEFLTFFEQAIDNQAQSLFNIKKLQKIYRCLRSITSTPNKSDSKNLTFVTYNRFISAFLSGRVPDWARRVFKDMIMDGYKPNTDSLNILARGISVHDGRGGWSAAELYTLYRKIKNTWSRTAKMNIETFNAFIYGFVKRARMTAAEEIWKAIQTDGIQPNAQTFLYMVSGYSTGWRNEHKAEIWFEMMNRWSQKTFRNFERISNVDTSQSMRNNLTQQNSVHQEIQLALVDAHLKMMTMYFNAAKWGKIVQLFDNNAGLFRSISDMTDLGHIKQWWDIVIAALCMRAEWTRLEWVLDKLSPKPNNATLMQIFRAYFGVSKNSSNISAPANAIKAFELVRARMDCNTDVSIFERLIDGLNRTGNYWLSLQVYDYLRQSLAPHPNIGIYFKLISSAAENQEISAAEKIFRDLLASKYVTPDLYTFNAFMNVYASSNPGEPSTIQQISTIYREMLSRNITPDIRTFNIIIKGFMNANQEDRAFEVYRMLIDNGIEPNHVTVNTLLGPYIQRQQWDAIAEIFAQEGVKVWAHTHTLNLLVKGILVASVEKGRRQEENSFIIGTNDVWQIYIGLMERMAVPVSKHPVTDEKYVPSWDFSELKLEMRKWDKLFSSEKMIPSTPNRPSSTTSAVTSFPSTSAFPQNHAFSMAIQPNKDTFMIFIKSFWNRGDRLLAAQVHKDYLLWLKSHRGNLNDSIRWRKRRR